MQVSACILKAVCPMLAVYGIVCGLNRHLGDQNGDDALNPLDVHDKRYRKLSSLFLLVLVLFISGIVSLFVGGAVASWLVRSSPSPGSSPGQGHCVVFLGKTLYSHSAPLHPGV